MPTEKIRLASVQDAEAILAIYKPYIEETVITFEYEVPSLEDFTKRIATISQNYAYLVYTVDDEIIGYAYAARQRERAAYNWNTELSIYLDQTKTHKGVGTRLYEALLTVLKEQQIYNVYGCMTCPNEPSERLHKKLGFKECGVFPHSGYKFDAWHSIKFFERCIADISKQPQAFKPITTLEPTRIEAILEAVFNKK